MFTLGIPIVSIPSIAATLCWGKWPSTTGDRGTLFSNKPICKTRIGLRNCMLDYVGILLYSFKLGSQYVPTNHICCPTASRVWVRRCKVRPLGPARVDPAKLRAPQKWDTVPWGLDHPWISWNRCGKPVVSAENWSTSGGFFYIYVSLEEDTWMRIPLSNSIVSHATWMGISHEYVGDAMVANHFLQVAGMHPRVPSIKHGKWMDSDRNFQARLGSLPLLGPGHSFGQQHDTKRAVVFQVNYLVQPVIKTSKPISN
jgi:hypothetical protein